MKTLLLNRILAGLFVVVLMSIGSSIALAQSDARLVLEPWAQAGQSLELSATTQFQSRRDAKGAGVPGGAKMGLTYYAVEGRYRFSEDQSPLSVGVDAKYIDISSNSGALPQRLYTENVGVGFHVGQLGDWDIDATLGAGYASTQPYKDSDSYYGKGNLIFRRQIDQQSGWWLLLNYNGNRSVLPDTPLPGVAYYKAVDDDLFYLIGLPYSQLRWAPADDWQVNVKYGLPTTATIDVRYNATESVDLFARYQSQLHIFQIADQSNYSRRLFFQRDTIELGAHWDVTPSTHLILAGGMALAQTFETGYDTRDLYNEIEIDDAPFIRLALEATF